MHAGYTQQDLGAMSADFRAAAHWLLYSERLAGDGFQSLGPIPHKAGGAAVQDWLHAKDQQDRLRAILYPEDDDGGT